MTGNVYGELKPINERPEQVMQILNKYFTHSVSINSTMGADIDNENISTGKDYFSIGVEKDTVFKALWNGAYQSEKCTSESEKDLALMGKLLYWCSGNADAAIEAFKSMSTHIFLLSAFFCSSYWFIHDLSCLKHQSKMIKDTGMYRIIPCDFNKEEVYTKVYYDFEDAQRAIFKYIESWYNRKRIHEALNYMTPQEKEDEFTSAA